MSQNVNPAYFMGRDEEPGADEAFAWLQCVEGPSLKTLDIRWRFSVWLQRMDTCRFVGKLLGERSWEPDACSSMRGWRGRFQGTQQIKATPLKRAAPKL